MLNSIAMPRFVRLGGGAAASISDMLSKMGVSRPLIVTDQFMVDSGNVETIVARIVTCGGTARVFAETVPEPTMASIEAGLNFLRGGDHDVVIALGGGSAMDSAKAIAVLGRHGGTVPAYSAPHIQDAPGLPLIAIPTTAGTGSEVTRFTVITDEERGEKMLCAGLAYLPVAAIVDYELTLSMPPRLTADTGIDALTHAIEAYVSRRANPMSDMFALEAMRMIGPNIRRAFADGQDRVAREAMMTGSTLAGLAFSNSSVALVHGMSRPIGAHFHVPHGLSNAMLLPLVTAFSISAAVGRYADCARALGLDVGVAVGDDPALAQRLVAELGQLNVDLGVPSPAGYGIDFDRWSAVTPLMAEQAIASGSPSNNPRIGSRADLETLYRTAWNGSLPPSERQADLPEMLA